MNIRTICGSGLGSSLLVEMNVKSVLEKLGVEYESCEHTNITSFTANGIDLIVVGADIAEAIDFPEDKKIVLRNILSKVELEEKLRKVFNLQ